MKRKSIFSCKKLFNKNVKEILSILCVIVISITAIPSMSQENKDLEYIVSHNYLIECDNAELLSYSPVTKCKEENTQELLQNQIGYDYHKVQCNISIFPMLQREPGRCDCGGRLSYEPRAYYTQITCRCTNPGHPGVISDGRGNWVKCTFCDGRGWYPKWHGAYVCKSCRSIYEKW